MPTPAAGTESYLTLDFDLATSLEDSPPNAVNAYDGLCLRIADSTGGSFTMRSVAAEAFATAITTGTGDGYTRRIARSTLPNYFATTSVWSGSSGGYKHVAMKFPGAGMTGHVVQLRFEYTEDGGGVCTGVGYGGPCGVAIDNVVFKYTEAWAVGLVKM